MADREVREYVQWGNRWDAIGNPELQQHVGHIDRIPDDTDYPDGPEAFAKVRHTSRQRLPGCQDTIMRRTVRVSIEYGEWEEA